MCIWIYIDILISVYIDQAPFKIIVSLYTPICFVLFCFVLFCFHQLGTSSLELSVVEIVNVCVLVSCCCCNKLPQMSWLKTVHYLPVLGVRSA